MRYYFPEVSQTGKKSGTCSVCGKKASRSKKFTKTVNPFNRWPNGVVKTTAEVRQDVATDVEKWMAEPVTHAGCKVEA